MISRLFTLILFAGLTFACDSGVAERTTDDPDEVTTSNPDGVFTKADGSSDWVDQSAQSAVTSNSADYDGKGTSPAEEAEELDRDSLKYMQTPEYHSTSPVGKNPVPNSTRNKD